MRAVDKGGVQVKLQSDVYIIHPSLNIRNLTGVVDVGLSCLVGFYQRSNGS